jgi:hypothetical protein
MFAVFRSIVFGLLITNCFRIITHLLRVEFKYSGKLTRLRIKQADVNPIKLAKDILKPLTFHNFLEMMATLNNYWILCEMA